MTGTGESPLLLMKMRGRRRASKHEKVCSGLVQIDSSEPKPESPLASRRQKIDPIMAKDDRERGISDLQSL